MKKNVGTIDRSIRGLVGLALIGVYFLGTAPGVFGTIALVAGIVLLGTAVFGMCPPYALLGINTCNVRKRLNE